jgi:hypothetical protein
MEWCSGRERKEVSTATPDTFRRAQAAVH